MELATLASAWNGSQTRRSVTQFEIYFYLPFSWKCFHCKVKALFNLKTYEKNHP